MMADWAPETLQVLAAVADRESAHNLVSISALIEATGLEPMRVADEVERLMREGLISGRFQKTLSGGDPSPWFIVGPLITSVGQLALKQGEPSPPAKRPSSEHGTDRRTNVFVVYGRDVRAKDAMFSFLQALGLHPIEFDEARGATGSPTPYIGEILEAGFRMAVAAVVLFTPDDEARLRTEFVDPGGADDGLLRSQARQNVVYEAGMAMATHAGGTVLVVMGAPRLPSDIDGRHYVQMNGSLAARRALRDRLRDAGCAIDKSRSDWESAGDFNLTGLGVISPSASGGADDTRIVLTLLEDELAGNELVLLAAAESIQRYTSPDHLGLSRTVYDTYGLDLGRAIPTTQHRLIQSAYRSAFPPAKLLELRGITNQATLQPMPAYYLSAPEVCRKAQMEVTAALSAVRQLLASM
jgi:predicted nucleotide-binding protein